MRPSLAVLTIAAGLALPTGVAAASTVSVDPPGGPAVLESGPFASDVTSRLVNFSALEFRDAAQPLTAGAGCTAGPPVSCVATDQDIRFGPASDRFRGFSLAPITISAGGGSDTIRTAGARNVVTAGGGNDQVWENGNASGSVDGGPGNDKLFSFEASADDVGGPGNDLVTTGSARLDNMLSGGDGNDELVASGFGAGTVDGGSGADVIVLDAQFGGYSADGGNGNDVIAGGPDSSEVTAGGGSDVVDVSGDGPGDTVDCGSGVDVVFYDAGDSVSRNCEIRTRGAAPRLPQIADARADAAAFVAAMPAIPAF
jgi:Ca2+-binding RTX toxin-like protein